MTEELKIRIWGNRSLPVLIYLPGLHGDWTLVGAFRAAMKGSVCFVEFTYPRTLEWSLDDYAAAIEQSLKEQGITRGWLLGESFGSQIVWRLLERKQLTLEGAFFAGGFGQHPGQWMVKLAEWLCAGVPLWLVKFSLFFYERFARVRFIRSPEIFPDLREFVQRRTRLDLEAATHRLRLIAAHNPSTVASALRTPVFAFTGGFDPIVPWPWARSWLRQNCVSLREYRVFWSADHTVLATAPRRSAESISTWMKLPKAA